MMNIGYNGLWGLLILAGDIWAIINILAKLRFEREEIDLDNRGGAAAAAGLDPVVFPRTAGRQGVGPAVCPWEGLKRNFQGMPGD